MEQDSHDSSEHLSLERISALLDQPGDDRKATRHLERCERCEREHERMRRMRMALSALGGVAPPDGEWEEIESRLPDRAAGDGTGGGGDDGVLPFRSGWMPRVAAATVVFAVGLSAGLQLRDGAPSGGGTADGSAPREAVRGDGTGRVADGAGAGARDVDGAPGTRLAATADDGSVGGDSGPYLSAARSLTSMVDGRPEASVEPIDDPVAAAEEMARLEALAEAAREALNEHPADPALNNFLFRVNERQESLRSRIGAAARLASLDYR